MRKRLLHVDCVFLVGLGGMEGGSEEGRSGEMRLNEASMEEGEGGREGGSGKRQGES